MLSLNYSASGAINPFCNERLRNRNITNSCSRNAPTLFSALAELSNTVLLRSKTMGMVEHNNNKNNKNNNTTVRQAVVATTDGGG